jgi:response regulator RpfG family c-di-GMP phosphodiesterase
MAGGMVQAEAKDRQNKRAILLLLVSNEKIRKYLLDLLQEYHYAPLLVANPGEALQILKKERQATVFMDCEAMSSYGVGICAKLKVACQHCRVVLLCDKRQPVHRQIIKEAMEIGIYACLLPPYEDWEVLTMVSFFPPK